MTTTIDPSKLNAQQLDELASRLAEIELTPALLGPNGEHIELPPELFEVLRTVAAQLAAGNGVNVMPLHAELTTAEAAEVLNMSRPHLIKLLEAGEMPFHKVGTHRRIMLADVVAYRERSNVERRSALAQLHDLADQHDLPLV